MNPAIFQKKNHMSSLFVNNNTFLYLWGALSVSHQCNSSSSLPTGLCCADNPCNSTRQMTFQTRFWINLLIFFEKSFFVLFILYLLFFSLNLLIKAVSFFVLFLLPNIIFPVWLNIYSLVILIIRMILFIFKRFFNFSLGLLFFYDFNSQKQARIIEFFGDYKFYHYLGFLELKWFKLILLIE